MSLEEISSEMQAIKECEQMLDEIEGQMELIPIDSLPKHQAISRLVRHMVASKADVYSPVLLEKLDKIDAIIERRMNESI